MIYIYYIIQVIITEFWRYSYKEISIYIYIAGIVLVFAIMGSSATSLFSKSVTEEAEVKLKSER